MGTEVLIQTLAAMNHYVSQKTFTNFSQIYEKLGLRVRFGNLSRYQGKIFLFLEICGERNYTTF
mgnify:CR=1 FL=1